MLFAAGHGTRMRPLTADRAKPLIPVAGRPLIDHALALVRAAGVGRTVVNTHYRAQDLAAHLDGRDVLQSHEPRLLDTGGGLKAALPLLAANPVFTLNTDAVWSGANPLVELAANWCDTDEALLLLAPRQGGDFTLDEAGRLTRGGPWIYTGAQIIRTERIASRSDRIFSLNVVWDRMIAAGTARGVVYSGQWCDVGTPEAIQRAEALVMRDG